MVHDGVMFINPPGAQIFALDARNGDPWLLERSADAQRMQSAINANLGSAPAVPQGGVVWVYAVGGEGK